jgi:hypothetical protein
VVALAVEVATWSIVVGVDVPIPNKPAEVILAASDPFFDSNINLFT